MIVKIMEQCQKISNYSRPVEIYFVDKLPQTSIGKTDITTLTKDATERRKQNIKKRKK